jgi:hypothetical protein
MSEIIKTTEIPHDELVLIYEQRCEDLKKEYDKNLQLKSQINNLQSHIGQLNSRLRKIFNESKIALSE